MRLVELHLDADRPIDLELHDRLTVVVADERTGRQIADLLGRAYILAGTEVTGTMDGGGFLTPLDPTAVVAQALDGDGLLTLTAADLPPPDTSRRDRARDAALAEITRLQPIVERSRANLSRHQRLHDATVAALAAGEDELITSTRAARGPRQPGARPGIAPPGVGRRAGGGRAGARRRPRSDR